MERYLSIEQAAQRLGVEYKTIYRLIRSGELPAGRIGRVYRIAEADLEHFFQQQKARLRQEASPEALVAGLGLTCGVCGQKIVSRLSIAGQCEHPECGQAICEACWTIRGARHCQEHAAAPKPAPAIGLTADARRADEADAHPSAESADIPQAAPPPGLSVAGREARNMELGFLRRFESQFTQLRDWWDPAADDVADISRWQRKITRTDESRALAACLPRGRRGTDWMLQTPLAGSVRVELWRNGERKRPALAAVAVARVVARPERYLEQGYDAEPTDLAAIEDLLGRATAEADQAGVPYALVLGSPTGWAESARGLLEAEPAGARFRHPWLGLVLRDLMSGDTIYNDADPQLDVYLSLAVPEEAQRRLADCVQRVREMLLKADSLRASVAAADLGVSERLVRWAFHRLAAAGGYVVDRFEDLGLVLSVKAGGAGRAT